MNVHLVSGLMILVNPSWKCYIMKLCSILDHTVYCKLNNIKKKNHKIFFQRLQSEVEGMEDLFKTVSKKFQAMIQDLSRDEVDRIMNTLKKEKGEQPCN